MEGGREGEGEGGRGGWMIGDVETRERDEERE